MTKIVALLLAAAVGWSGCGSRGPDVRDIEGVPAVAFTPLTEDDVARFVRIFPDVERFLADQQCERRAELTARSTAGDVMMAAIDWVGEVDGIDSVLAASGADWKFLRAMLCRLAACSWVVGFRDESVDPDEAIRRQTNSSMANAMRRRLAQMKTVAHNVPTANVEMFERHYRELRCFFRIVEFGG